MIKFVLALLVIPLFSFAQDITGLWIKNPESNTALEFKPDGTFTIKDLNDCENTILKNVTVRYTLSSDTNGITFINYFYYHDNKLIKEEKTKYKFKDGMLLLPRTVEMNGIETIQDYADAYARINKAR